MNIFKQTLLFSLVYALPVLSAYGQANCEDEVHLIIREEATSLPVPGAAVGFSRWETLTDINGYCLIAPVCAARLHLHVRSMGYAIIDQDFSVQNGDTLIVQLKKSNLSLDAVEIQGHKQVLATPNTAVTIPKTELNKVAGKSLAASIQSVAGVSLLQTGSTIEKAVINGMHSNRILVLNNGIRQEGQQWGAEHAPEIDPFLAQHITVVKGAEAIRYGPEAVGGVIILDPPPLPQDSAIHGSLNLVGASNGRMFAAAGMLSGNVKKLPALSWRIQGSGKKSGNVKTAEYFLNNTGVRELNYSAAAAYTRDHFDMDLFYSHFNTELGIFKGSHIGSIEDLELRIAHGRPFETGNFSYAIEAPRQQISHHLLKLRSHIHFSDHLHLTAVYGLQKDSRQEYDIRRGDRTDIPSLDLSLWNQNLDLVLDYFNGRQWKLNFGIIGNYQQNESVEGTFTTPLIPDFIAQSLGIFGIGKYLKSQYQLEFGLRYDYKFLNALGYHANQELYGGKHNFNNLSGNIGAVWNISKGWDLSSNIGTAWRSPSVNELYSTGLHHGAASYELGNDQLKSEQSVKWITTISHENRQQWFRLDLDMYAHFFDNYIYLKPTGQFWESLRGTFPEFDYQQTNARFLGLDLSTQFDFLKQWSYDIKASLVRAKDLSNNSYLPMIPSDRLEQGLTWKIPLSPLKNSYIQLTHAFVARQNRTEPASDFAAAPEAYHLLNLNLGTVIPVQRHDFQIDFTVRNLSNALYKDYMNRFRYYAHDVGRSAELRLAYQF